MAKLSVSVLDPNSLFNSPSIPSLSQFKGAKYVPYFKPHHTFKPKTISTRCDVNATPLFNPKLSTRNSWCCHSANSGALMSFQLGDEHQHQHVVYEDETTRTRFKNRYLNLVRLGSVINQSAESFFKSEIRRRLFVTCALLLLSRLGYFIPLPGFDRRLIPLDYLSFVSGAGAAAAAADELGDYAPELKMSFFQLGISPQIAASILMQILCHVVPSLVKLRKEGLDGNEKIKSYMYGGSLLALLYWKG